MTPAGGGQREEEKKREPTHNATEREGQADVENTITILYRITPPLYL
jgi:hypothetical protein